MRDDTLLFIVLTAIALSGIAVLIYSAAHGGDAKLKAECEAKGGIFVEARQPMHVCVKEAR